MNETVTTFTTIPVNPYYSNGENIPDIIYFYLVIQLTIICFQIYKQCNNHHSTQGFASQNRCCNDWKLKYINFSIVKSICVISTIISIIAYSLTISRYDSMNEQIYLFTIVYGNYIVQVCDNSIFILGYRALHKKTITNRFIVAYVIYIVIFMSLSWLPIYIILPYVSVDETNSFIQIYMQNGTNIYSYANILYNLYFTVEFIKIIYFYHRNLYNTSQSTYIIAVKCLIHCITSNTGILILNYYNVNSNETSCTYIFILTMSMNILFNISIEKKTSALYRSIITVVYSIHKVGSEISSKKSVSLNNSTKSVMKIEDVVRRTESFVILHNSTRNIEVVSCNLEDLSECNI